MTGQPAAMAVAEVLAAQDPSSRFDPAQILTPVRAAVVDANTLDGGAPQPLPPNLPAEFWASSPRLEAIRSQAHRSYSSADAVLGHVLARVAALTPPAIEPPDLTGKRGSLNLIVSLIGGSGAGKTTAKEPAEMITPAPLGTELPTLPLGTGEGLIEAYRGDVPEVDDEGTPTGKSRREQVRPSVLFSLDEGQTLLVTSKGRSGATILEHLRSAWSGIMLGQSNATRDTTRRIDAWGYRFALVVGFQPTYAADVLHDAAGGTPQRFLWLSATDPDLDPERPMPAGVSPWRPQQFTAGPLTADPLVGDDVTAARRAAVTGTAVVDELDAHRDYLRLKVAALLAILDERHHVTGEDWRLAGLVMDTSDGVRDHVVATAAREANRRERSIAGRLAARSQYVEESQEERALASASKAIARKAHRSHEGLTRGQCTTAITGKHRKLVTVDDAITEAERRGWLVEQGGRYCAGEVAP